MVGMYSAQGCDHVQSVATRPHGLSLGRTGANRTVSFSIVSSSCRPSLVSAMAIIGTSMSTDDLGILRTCLRTYCFTFCPRFLSRSSPKTEKPQVRSATSCIENSCMEFAAWYPSSFRAPSTSGPPSGWQSSPMDQAALERACGVISAARDSVLSSKKGTSSFILGRRSEIEATAWKMEDTSRAESVRRSRSVCVRSSKPRKPGWSISPGEILCLILTSLPHAAATWISLSICSSMAKSKDQKRYSAVMAPIIFFVRVNGSIFSLPCRGLLPFFLSLACLAAASSARCAKAVASPSDSKSPKLPRLCCCCCRCRLRRAGCLSR
mmetsp:Transcript_74081/g.192375  ORF Transcript_74081/g.192375 Transcript_74081/m.192375 type:complete len:323 (+) Transcript_74081:463-1431(+)